MDKSTTRNGKDSTRAERKAERRLRENAVSALPNNDGHTLGTEDHATLAVDKLKNLSKKRKRDENSTLSNNSDKEFDIAARGKTRKLKEPNKLFSKKREERMITADKRGLTASSPVAFAMGEHTARTSQEKISVEKSQKATNTRKKRRKTPTECNLAENSEVKFPRFIVFIGNLPFTATEESMRKHFAAVNPKSIRHLTKKDDPTKSRGCAFLEFEGYDYMKSCLKSFHHSLFDDGISAPRKINVELTVGGGGNKKNRQVKIHEKNQKLNEERKRKVQEEGMVRLARKDPRSDYSAVHPSRRARVPDMS